MAWDQDPQWPRAAQARPQVRGYGSYCLYKGVCVTAGVGVIIYIYIYIYMHYHLRGLKVNYRILFVL